MSIDYMNAEHTITDIVDAMLPRSTYERLGLQIKVDISAEDYSADPEDENTNRAWREIKLLFVRPSNYTQVYVSVRSERGEEDKWELHSDHDSCWRSDGLRTIFQCVAEVCKAIAPNKPFAAANPRVNISSFNGIQYVLLKERVDKELNIFSATNEPRKLSYYYNRDNRKVEDLVIEKTMDLKEAIPYFAMKSVMSW